jgi:hypothetical protein
MGSHPSLYLFQFTTEKGKNATDETKPLSMLGIGAVRRPESFCRSGAGELHELWISLWKSGKRIVNCIYLEIEKGKNLYYDGKASSAHIPRWCIN